MNRWPIVPLEEFVAKKSGSVDPAMFPDEVFDLYSIPAFDAGQPDVCAGSEIGSAKQVVQPNDVLLSRIVPHIRRAWVVGEIRNRRLIASGEWIVFRGPQIRPRYLRYFLVGDPFHAQFMQTVSGVGGSLLRAKATEVAKIKVPVPPLAEQERIVKLLDEADELRKLRAQADRRAADLIPALFHELFGDPVANPKNWPRHKLPELCENKEGIKAGPFGSSLKKECFTSEGPRVYGQEQVIAGDFSIGDYHISEAKFAEMAAYIVERGDLLISLVGTIGKVVVVPAGIERGIINPRLLRVRPCTGLVHPCYLATVLTSPSIIQLLGSVATGITMGVLNAGMLKRLDVPLPPLPLQKEFAARVSEIRAMQAEQAASRRRLDDLFQSMLHRAFNGEL